MKKRILSSKQYVAWVTELIDKYRVNPFFRATVHIIFIQLAFVLVLMLISPSLIHIFTIALIGVFSVLLIHHALTPTRITLKLQKRFVGNIAHELRTPLAIIKTSTEVALMDPTISPEQYQSYKDTLDEVARMSDAINTLLTFDSLLNFTSEHIELVDVGSIAQEVLARYHTYAYSRGIRIIADIQTTSQNTLLVMGNSAALDQAISNLLKNALTFTPAHEDKEILVSVSKNPAGKILLTLTDSGIGINENDLYHIFDPYFRSDVARTRGVDTGTNGLGLTIVREIVRLHRGRISVDSTIGTGTVVSVSFPSHS